VLLSPRRQGSAIVQQHLILTSRRAFLRAAAASAVTPLIYGSPAHARLAPDVLYNGIVLGSPWPPSWKYPADHPVRPPYLANPPAVIPIDVGRQLFVDDFLIEDTTLVQSWHRPVYYASNPILRPDRPWEARDEYAERTGTAPNPSAMVFSDGVFFDRRERVFKMWYMGGYGVNTCLATSPDGVRWTKPALDVVPGTNIVHANPRDSSTVWFDQFERDPRHRFKMSLWYDHALDLLVSHDGVHWNKIGRTGPAGDRSTFFYNPFRRVWVFSIRAEQRPAPASDRYRRYWEGSDFAAARAWSGAQSVAWVKADSRDSAAPGYRAVAELYNLDAVAYESVLLGLFSIWRGESGDREKINEVTVGFSRDGFHWHRPDRSSFLPISPQQGAWNWANVQSAGGGCLIVGDQLFFYVSGRQGRPGTNAPGVCATGLATLRRDGFASMSWGTDGPRMVRHDFADGTGTLTTRPVMFSGKYVFVNADARGGELRVELLDHDGRVIAPFTRDRCVPITSDGTRQAVRWSVDSVGEVAGQPVRFRFLLTRGRLYSFWVSAWPTGESGGYPAAGGPEFAGGIDAPAV
jgi:hypothetical protein